MLGGKGRQRLVAIAEALELAGAGAGHDVCQARKDRTAGRDVALGKEKSADGGVDVLWGVAREVVVDRRVRRRRRAGSDLFPDPRRRRLLGAHAIAVAALVGEDVADGVSGFVDLIRRRDRVRRNHFAQQGVVALALGVARGQCHAGECRSLLGQQRRAEAIDACRRRIFTLRGGVCARAKLQQRVHHRARALTTVFDQRDADHRQRRDVEKSALAGREIFDLLCLRLHAGFKLPLQQRVADGLVVERLVPVELVLANNCILFAVGPLEKLDILRDLSGDRAQGAEIDDGPGLL